MTDPKRRRISSSLACLLSILTLDGCAKVSITPLDATGNRTQQAEGLRYYLPKPYLLIMAIPGGPTPAGDQTPQQVDLSGNPVRPGAAPAQTAAPTPSATATAPTAGNTSYQAANAQYVAKLIYLPDYSHPMAVSESGGLFGTVSLAAALQDGWQLTSLQGNSDAKAAETLTALSSLISAVGGVAAGGVGGASRPGQAPTAASPILPPGLYAFNFNPAGILLNLCQVTPFDSSSTTAPRCPETAHP